MVRHIYAEALADDEGLARGEESVGLIHLVKMLEKASTVGVNSRESIEALASFNAVWSALLEDLADNENYLPLEMRARLISIGIFLMKETEKIQRGRSSNWSVLIDVTGIIAEGLL